MERLLKEKDIIDNQMQYQSFWEDLEGSQKQVKRNKEIEEVLEDYEDAQTGVLDLEVLFEMAQEDESMEKELEKELQTIHEKIEELKLETMLDQEHDNSNAILSIHAGSGGLDAQDWAKMLLRMYTRFAQEMKFKVKELDYNQDPEAGIKSVTLRISGKNAYGFLKSEKGVHRLVRMSQFDSSGKRHTSFASVDVIPELDDTVNIDINTSDLKIDTYRSGGAGGQHVNKTDSAVRITHQPTGIVVQCQNERSQLINKDVCMKMLMAKLIDLKKQEHKDKIEDLQGEYSQIGWGSQIRSYVFQPYTLVKDHRTAEESGNVNSVMDGNIMPFILAYLRNQKM
nr:peptide chain release factor 2 [Proteocatella sphenisci]